MPIWPRGFVPPGTAVCWAWSTSPCSSCCTGAPRRCSCRASTKGSAFPSWRRWREERSSSLPEVGGDAVLYFQDPADPEHLARVLEAALGDTDLQANLERTARARAAKFTWDATAAGVAAVITDLL